MLYAAEPIWNGKKGVQKEHQDAINRISRANLGAFRSMPLGILAAESCPTAARALLNHRRASFARHLYARPQGGDGPEEILECRDSSLTTRIRAAAALRRHKTVEPQAWGTGRRFAAQIVVKPRVAATLTANQHRQANTV